MRGLLRSTLRGAGYDCLEATDGRGALDVLATEAVDLILTDLWMEGMDGLEFTKNLKHDRLLRHTPVLVLTTDANPENWGQLRRAGALGVVEKKIAPQGLLSAVDRALATV